MNWAWPLCFLLLCTLQKVAADPLIQKMEEMERKITDMQAQEEKRVKMEEERENTINRLKNGIEILEERIKVLESGNQANQVAFAAYRGAGYDVDDRQVIVYDNTWLNTGNYNTETGEFTCPVNGVYYFAVSAHTGSGDHTLVTLESTNSIGPAAFADAEHSDQGATVWVTPCAANEKVFLRENNPGGSRVDASRNDTFVVSFVGFLIYLS